jgi:predicted nucleotidyltransferase
MKSINERTAIIKDAILKHVAAKYIYLFGSYAYGEPTKDSDIDIYVVVPDDTEGSLRFLQTDILLDIDGDDDTLSEDYVSIDMLIERERVFNDKKDGSMFLEIILSKGKLLYAA